MEERGFKELTITPCSYQDRSHRVRRKPEVLSDPLPLAADSIPVPDVGIAMVRAGFCRAYIVQTSWGESPVLSLVPK